MNLDRMLKPALIGGVVAGVASSLPKIGWLLNCCCCALVIGGGVLASYLYIKDSPVKVTAGEGAMVGLLAGVFCALTMSLLSIPMSMLSGGPAGQLAEARPFLDRLPPEWRGPLETAIRQQALRGFSVIGFLFGLMFSLFTFGLFSTAGGALGVSFFEKRTGGGDGPYPPPPYPPPPSPSYEPPPPPPPS